MKKITSPKTIEERKIYAFYNNGVVYVLQHLRNIYGFKPILRGYEMSEYSSFYSKEAMENALSDKKEIIEFNTQKDFFEYFANIEDIGVRD
ncbi:MAG: hypothetical protein KAH10_07090 [Flavobacteriales bacterium]|nr:hypothetical protein [Flavobacteriales bacterium]